MSTDVKDPPDQTAASLVSGILGDLQHLVEQQFRLTRREIEDEIRQRTTAAAVLVLGATVVLSRRNRVLPRPGPSAALGGIAARGRSGVAPAVGVLRRGGGGARRHRRVRGTRWPSQVQSRSHRITIRSPNFCRSIPHERHRRNDPRADGRDQVATLRQAGVVGAASLGNRSIHRHRRERHGGGRPGDRRDRDRAPFRTRCSRSATPSMFRRQVDRHPWLAVGGSVVLGCLAVEFLSRLGEEDRNSRWRRSPRRVRPWKTRGMETGSQPSNRLRQQPPSPRPTNQA